jgi:Fe-S oxidoreductase
VLRRRRRPHVDGGDIGKKVNDERSQELLATGATRIATACPFCYIMIDDGVKGAGRKEEDEVKVADIAMHLLEAIETGEKLGGLVAEEAQD